MHWLLHGEERRCVNLFILQSGQGGARRGPAQGARGVVGPGEARRGPSVGARGVKGRSGGGLGVLVPVAAGPSGGSGFGLHRIVLLRDWRPRRALDVYPAAYGKSATVPAQHFGWRLVE